MNEKADQVDETAPPGGGRRSQKERREEATNGILNAAETLFAQHGLHGVTLREVAEAADVDTALVHYYFKNKDRLFREVFSRRAVQANSARLQALDDYVEQCRPALTLEGVIDAFTRPGLELVGSGDPGFRNYGALVGIANNTPGWGQAMMAEYFDPVSQKLLGLFREILPDSSEEDIYWCYHFLTGAFTFSLAQTGRIDKLSGGLCKSTDMGAIAPRLTVLFGAGMAAVCKNRLTGGDRQKPSLEPGARRHAPQSS